MYKILYEDDTYLVRLTKWGGHTFLHADVKVDKFTIDSVRLGRKVFKEIVNNLLADGVETLFALTPSPRFVKLVALDYESLGEIDGMELIVWELKQQLQQ